MSLTRQRLGAPSCVALSCIVLWSLLLGVSVPAAAGTPSDCHIINGNGHQCYDDAQNSPIVTWAQGMYATFSTQDGYLAGTHVNSIGLIGACGGQYELGWSRDPGSNRFHVFLYADTCLYTYSPPDFEWIGEANATYFIHYYGGSLQYFDFSVWQGSTEKFHFAHIDNPAWYQGAPVTNAELHSQYDTWTTHPFFTNLHNLSSTPAWSLWNKAQCYLDTSPLYDPWYYQNPIQVLVSGPETSDCSNLPF